MSQSAVVSPTPDTRPSEGEHFGAGLAVITAIGLLVRFGYVYAHARNHLIGDAYAYHNAANLLVRGHGFIVPVLYEFGHKVQAADHPPLYTLFLAIPSSLGLQTVLEHLVWSSLLGTSTIVVAGFLGRRVGGARVGLITAILVALAPNIWLYDGDVLSETLAIFVTTLALLLAYRALERSTSGRICALGAACGAAALTRSELVLLIPALLWPIAVIADRDAPTRQKLERVAIGTLVAAAMIAPWTAYNLTRFRHPVILSSQLEPTLAGANCDDTYSGPSLGLITLTCLKDVSRYADQSVTEQQLRPEIWHFVSTHKSRVPIVVAARLGRVTGLYAPRQQVNFDVNYETRERRLAQAGLLNSYLFEVGAIAGFFVWRRRKVPRWPLLVLPGIALFTVAVTYGTNRFRASAEVSLALLTAVAIDAVWDWARHPAAQPAANEEALTTPG
jgi:4-amino-4-deoxy-L-arabinose transferase-like glycosyltransferase